MKRRNESWWLLVAGLLLIFAGIRDWVAPGFLSITGRAHGDIALNLLLGVVFVAAAWQKGLRRA